MHDEYCEAIRFKSGLCNCKERALSDSGQSAGSVSGNKVSLTENGAMHLQHPQQDGYTLCGVKWFYLNDHGESYCRNCQRILAGIRRKPNDNVQPDAAEQG